MFEENLIIDIKKLKKEVEGWDDVNNYVDKKFVVKKINKILNKYEQARQHFDF